MQFRFLTAILLTILCDLVFTQDISGQEWKFAKERDGIKIYTRNEENTPLKSFRGETNLKTDMKTISRVIGRIESFEWWDDDVSEINVLSYEEEEHISYYLVYDLPWPITDRDLCVKSVITNDPVTGKRTIIARPLLDVIPEKPDKVRIKNYWQQWTMEPAGNGMVHLTLEGSVDPGGSIPSWIINLVITDTPLNIMKKVREQVEVKEY